jgi:hypothetical protein
LKEGIQIHWAQFKKNIITTAKIKKKKYRRRKLGEVYRGFDKVAQQKTNNGTDSMRQ